MKQYCSIPDSATIKSARDISDQLAELFRPYRGDGSSGGYSIGYDEVFFRVILPGRTLEFAFKMPNFYDWLFFNESVEEMVDGYNTLGEDYEPMRCLPLDVANAWNRLMFYRADRMISLITKKLQGVTDISEAFESRLPLNLYDFDGFFELHPREQISAETKDATLDEEIVEF